jgi:hypothetical protein
MNKGMAKGLFSVGMALALFLVTPCVRAVDAAPGEPELGLTALRLLIQLRLGASGG